MKTYYHNGSHQLWQRNLQLEKTMGTEKELDEILKGKIWMQKKIIWHRWFNKVGVCEH